MKINRWIYLATGLVGGLLLMYPVLEAEQASNPGFEAHWYFLAANVLVSVLTHPAGVLAQVAVLPLVLLGVATQGESILLMLPLALCLGYVQWYVVLPRLFRRNGMGIGAKQPGE